jgi:hypothetical protein
MSKEPTLHLLSEELDALHARHAAGEALSHEETARLFATVTYWHEAYSVNTRALAQASQALENRGQGCGCQCD